MMILQIPFHFYALQFCRAEFSSVETLSKCWLWNCHTFALAKSFR